jgi:hypothetical protein
MTDYTPAMLRPHEQIRVKLAEVQAELLRDSGQAIWQERAIWNRGLEMMLEKLLAGDVAQLLRKLRWTHSSQRCALLWALNPDWTGEGFVPAPRIVFRREKNE